MLRPIACFSEKLNGAKLKYSTFDLEFYAIVHSVKNWSYYLASIPIMKLSSTIIANTI